MKKIITFLGVLLMTNTLLAQNAPKTLNLQGLLTDNAGVAVSPANTYSFVFKIWNAASGGTQVSGWSETHPTVSVDGEGIYNIVIGSITPINLNFDIPYWLEIAVNGETFNKRLELTGAAYVLDADIQDLATDGSLSGSKVGSGINASNITTGTLSSLRLQSKLDLWQRQSTIAIYSMNHNRLDLNSYEGIRFTHPSRTDYWQLKFPNAAYIEIFKSDNGSFKFNNGGRLTISGSDPYFEVGSYRLTTSGVINTSDLRLKKEIKSIEYGLDEILRLNPVSYKYIDDLDTNLKLGLIAQEIQQIIPEMVFGVESEESFLRVNYTILIPVLIKSVQEQQIQIEELKKQNILLLEESGEIKVLRTRLEKIEELLNVTGSNK